MCFSRVGDVKSGFIQAVAGRRTAGGGRGGGPHGLRIQMNHHPAQIIIVDLFISPDNRRNRLLAATDARDDALSHIRIETVWSVFGIVQARNGQPHRTCQAHPVIADRFLQNDEAA